MAAKRSLLRRGTWFDAQQAHEQVIAYLEKLLTSDERELSFWTSFGQQEYRPELLFQDADILSRIGQHPMALWKRSDNDTEMPQIILLNQYAYGRNAMK